MSTPRNRRRSYVSFRGHIDRTNAALPQFDEHTDGILTSTETCVDSSNDWRSIGNGDVGGTFDVSSTVYYPTPCVINDVSGSKAIRGTSVPLRFISGPGGPSTPVSTGELTLLSLGATAIARTAPTNPSFDLANALGELGGDGLPKVVGMQTLKEKARYLKNSGDEYLNAEFGWLPLVSDLRGFARTVQKSKQILDQFHKGSDQKIRRRYAFPSSQNDSVRFTGQDSVGGVLMYPSFGSNGTGQASDTVTLDTWFSGAFKYHVPMGNDYLSRFERHYADAGKLLGVELTPSTVWELAPWSWAVDWFSNTGDVIRNISLLGKDGLVLEYGYLMDKFVQRTDLSVSVVALNKSYTGSLTTVTKRLKRRRATPYGFGFDLGSLTASQEAVIVALGFSHGSRR